MMKLNLSYLFVLLAGLFLSACADVMPLEEPLPPQGNIRFSASNAMMITRSGLEYENFEVGTKYRIFGVEASETYNWGGAALKGTEDCYETDSHLIYYGPDIHFHDKTYDFYGATLCSTGEDYPVDVAAGGSPVISLVLDTADPDDVLEDLMYSNTLKGCTAVSGLLQMNFIHALSKIQVEVSRQNDSEELKYARVHGIVLKNTHTNGHLDIVSGIWNLDPLGTGTVERTFTDTPVSLSTTASMVKDAAGNDAHMLIFPNGEDETLSVEIRYSLDQAGEEIKTVTCAVQEPGTTDGSPFRFRQNHRYTLSVTITNDGVQIVTVLPKVYEWIDITVPSYLGQPVTFGNLMWMDRNLGAISADYENDWYNTIGHYFQFGRNIPYILDVEKFKEYTGDAYGYVNFAGNIFYVMKYAGYDSSSAYVENQWYINSTAAYYTNAINRILRNSYGMAQGNATAWDPLSAEEKTELIMKSVECIYTYDHLGNKVYGTQYVAPGSVTAADNTVVNASDELVRSPGYHQGLSGLTDEQLSRLYRFGFGTKQPEVDGGGYLQKPTVWTFNNSCGAIYWETGAPEKDPCPKGWRLPSKEDLEVLMPTVPINWDNIDYTETVYYPRTRTTDTEDIRYGKTENGHHVCYILKNKGTVNAYRLRIMSHYTNDGKNNKRYFSIARYGATKDDTDLSKYLDGTLEATTSATSKESTMWANPIEIIKYPACGFIVPDTDGTPETVHPDLRSFGFGTVLRTSDSNPNSEIPSSTNGFNFVQYLSTTDYQLGIQENSRRSLGDQIRCVRDINAVD